MDGFSIQFDGNNQIYFEHNFNETDLTKALTKANKDLAQQIEDLEKEIDKLEKQQANQQIETQKQQIQNQIKALLQQQKDLPTVFANKLANKLDAQETRQLLYDLLNAKKTGNEKQFNVIIQQLRDLNYDLPSTWLATGKTTFTLDNVKTDEIQKTLNAEANKVRNDAENDEKLKVDFANDVYFAWTGIQLQQAFIHKGETEKVLAQITAAQEESKKYTSLLTTLTKFAGNGATDDTITWPTIKQDKKKQPEQKEPRCRPFNR